MIYKATITLSLLSLALSGSAQSDVEGTLTTSGQPQSALPSVTQISTTQICPSGPPVSPFPTASDSASSRVHDYPRPSDCQPPFSAIPTVTESFQQPPSGAFPSGAPDSSLVPRPISTPIISGCQPYSQSTIPTVTGNVPPFSGSAFPSAGPNPYITTIENGTTISLISGTPTGTPSSQSAPSSGPIQQDPSTATASHVGRRRLVRRQV